MQPVGARIRQVAAASAVRKVYLIHCSCAIRGVATWSMPACVQAAARSRTRALSAPRPSRSPKVSEAGVARCRMLPSASSVALMKHSPPSTLSAPKRASSSG